MIKYEGSKAEVKNFALFLEENEAVTLEPIELKQLLNKLKELGLEVENIEEVWCG